MVTQTSRRVFLQQAGVALAAAAFRPYDLFASKDATIITGVQLYSVRDDMAREPLPTLRSLSKMGYRYVEHAGYTNHKFYGYPAAEFRKVLQDLNMKMLSGHTVLTKEHWNATAKDFTDAWKKTVDDAAIVGQQYIISPWMDENLRKNYDEVMRFMEVFNRCGELCKRSGTKFGYHNHNFEFSEKLQGKKLFDIIMQNTQPDLVAQQLDIGNMYHAGAKALDVLKQYPGRFELMHVKDEIRSSRGEMGGPYESTVLGKGLLPLKAVMDFGKKQGGTSHFIIEQESYQGKTPLECMRANLAAMKKWGYT